MNGESKRLLDILNNIQIRLLIFIQLHFVLPEHGRFLELQSLPSTSFNGGHFILTNRWQYHIPFHPTFHILMFSNPNYNSSTTLCLVCISFSYYSFMATSKHACFQDWASAFLIQFLNYESI